MVIHLSVSVFKSRAKSLMMLEELTRSLHKKLAHEIRNQITRLNDVAQTVRALQFESEVERNKFDALLTEEYNLLKSNVQPYVDWISEYLSSITTRTVSTCIKIFAFDEIDVRLEDKHLLTIARCKYTDNKRKKENDLPIIGKNTDFLDLCRGLCNFYASSDLHKKHKSGEYISDSHFFKEEMYTSTIVVPIRQVTTNFKDYKLQVKPNVIGFLCIDSEASIPEWEKEDTLELHLLYIYADLLYVYLNSFYTCFNISINPKAT
jgi:hypothetical protein